MYSSGVPLGGGSIVMLADPFDFTVPTAVVAVAVKENEGSAPDVAADREVQVAGRRAGSAGS